jgi:hypothetical protein
MPIYTAKINGRGIAAFDSADLVAAEDWAWHRVSSGGTMPAPDRDRCPSRWQPEWLTFL